MLKVNLEKELTREARQIVSARELLLLKEVDFLDVPEAEGVLSRIGMDSNLKNTRELKNSLFQKEMAIRPFNLERIFHESQIEKVCHKYYLRFLPTKLYKGTVDKMLPWKIQVFENEYGVKCSKDNCFIMAPKASFNLEQKPKDPLFFYQITEDYYYLVHKWGNDLSLTRRLLSLFSRTWFTTLLLLLTATVLLFTTDWSDKKDLQIVAHVLPALFCCIVSIFCFAEGRGIIAKNYYRNRYI